MFPLYTLTVAFVVFRLAGFGVPYFADWHLALRAALGVMFALTASAHWGARRADLVAMVPPGFGNAAALVSFTGYAELAAAVGLQIPVVASLAAGASVVLLCALFPANVRAARLGLSIGGKPVTPLVPRAAIQAVFIAALVASVWPIGA